MELREEVESRVERAAKETVEQDEDVDEVDIYLGKLEGGLASLQLIDYITAWICMEDDGVSASPFSMDCPELMCLLSLARSAITS